MENVVDGVDDKLINKADEQMISTPLVSMNPANVWRRALAWFVDFVLWFGILGYIFALITNQTTSNGFVLQGSSAVLLICVGFTYYFLTEAIWGATLGKAIFKIKVLKEDGQKISFKESLIRNLSRIIDMLPLFYIVGIMSITNSNKKQRVGDKLAHTIVVKTGF